MARKRPACDDGPCGDDTYVNRESHKRVATRAGRALVSLSDETLLHILANLNVRDVVRVERVCKRLARLTRDSQSWRRRFQRDYALWQGGRPAHLPSATDVLRQLYMSSASRMMAPSTKASILQEIPPMYHRSVGAGRLGIDWRALYRTTRNWTTGNFSVSALGKPAKETVAELDEYPSDPAMQATLVQATNMLVFTASRAALPPGDDSAAGCARVPLVHIYLAEDGAGEQEREPIGCAYPDELVTRLERDGRVPASITEMRVEHSDVLGPVSCTARLAVFYTQRYAVIYAVSIESGAAVARVEHMWDYTTPGTLARPVVMSAFRSSVLVTCTRDFLLCVWHAPASAPPTLLGELRSHSCHWPACMSLAEVHGQDSRTFRLTVAFVQPSFSTWSVTMQDFHLRLADKSGALQMHVESRLASAQPAAIRGSAAESREQASKHSARHPVSSIIYDADYIVLGTHDNLLHVYHVDGAPFQVADTRARRAASATPPAAAALQLAYCGTLYGHTGRICSVAMDGSRCVSGSADGSVMVWARRDRLNFVHLMTLRYDPQVDIPVAHPRVHVLPATENSRKVPELSLANVARLLRERVTHGGIRWVSTAFDKIVCVSEARPVQSTCRATATRAGQAKEQVQIWNFNS